MQPPKLKYLWSYLYHWSELMPDAVAYHFNGQSVTYKSLERQVNNMARSLLELGIDRGDRIVSILPSRPEYLVTYLAASQLGAILVPFDVRYKTEDLKRFLSRMTPKVILAVDATKDQEVASQLMALAEVWSLDCLYYIIGQSSFGRAYAELVAGDGQVSAKVLERRTTLNEEAGDLIIFTGGTTGQPKAALLSAKNVLSMAFYEEQFLRRQLRKAGFTGRIASLAALPPSHVGGSIEIIGTGLLGAYELYFQEHWSPTEVLAQTQEAKIPWIGGVPTMYQILLALPELNRYDLSELYLAMVSGERLTLELIQGIHRRICPRLVNGYGSTEAGPEVTFTLPEDDPRALAKGYAGKPLPTVELKIVDEEGQTLPAGQKGEVLVRSDFTIKNYYRMPKEDEAGFDPDGFCRTGDLGYLDNEGGLYLSGRKKHIIRVGSYTVMPTEIEEVAQQIPEVALAASLGAPHPIYQEVVWLFVVLQEGDSIAEASIIRYISERLADFKVPKRVIIRESIPTTRIGKADRKALEKEMAGLDWKVVQPD